MVMQMKMIHQNGYTHEERIEFRPTIWKNLLETSRSIVQVLQGLNVEPATPPQGSSEVRRFRLAIFFVT
jgi:guanine nucleotide-binding protein G(i) subunit alpha